MKEKLRALFASNTEKNEIHYTSDGVCFWDKNHALSHARDRENKTVVTVSRYEAEREETDAEVLARIEGRKKEIQDTMTPFKAEWDSLTEQEEALLEKMGPGKFDPNDLKMEYQPPAPGPDPEPVSDPEPMPEKEVEPKKGSEKPTKPKK